jgi:hypothetical protein
MATQSGSGGDNEDDVLIERAWRIVEMGAGIIAIVAAIVGVWWLGALMLNPGGG